MTDAEVFHEILHRYVAIDRCDAIQPAFAALGAIVEEVFPIDAVVVETARDLVLGGARVSARDAVHAAVMVRNRVGTILSFHRGFDSMAGIRRFV